LAITIEGRKYRRVKVGWPIKIFTDQGTIEGQIRNITSAGVFIHCKAQLRQNAIYRMVIKPYQMSIEVKGKVIWAGHDDNSDESTIRGFGVYFAEISEADLQVLVDPISVYLKKMEAKKSKV
jgi:hypothetical protein